MKRVKFLNIFLAIYLISLQCNLVLADDNDVSNTVDASRIKPGEDFQSQAKVPGKIEAIKKSPQATTSTRSEENNIKFTLKKINLSGITALDPILVKKIYAPYLNTLIDLNIVDKIVEEITELYRKSDYFTSLAYLPEQKISKEKGIVNIIAIESYIKDIELPPETEKYNKTILDYINYILQERPLTAKSLEKALLQINDLFGYKFKGVLTKSEDSEFGAIKLSINTTNIKSKTSIIFDNYSSKFIGPHEISVSQDVVFSPFNRLFINGATNPFDIKKLNQYSLNNIIKVNNQINLNISSSFNKTAPITMLKNLSTISKSKNASISLSYQLIRQRIENFKLGFSFNVRNSNNYIMDILSSQDQIRTLKCTLNYDKYDSKQNYHSLSFTLTRGLDILSATPKSYKFKSRSLAIPNFHKIEGSYFYWCNLIDKMSLLFSLYSQYAINILYASEEFGYGGQLIGRAFDNSEISGDHGLASIIELNYNDLKQFENYKIIPYFYYDLGVVWRKDPSRKNKESAGSTGFGIRSNLYKYFDINLGLSWPLIKEITTPIYGGNNKNPRIVLKINFEY